MKTKKQIICLRCGTIQVRTDIENTLTDRYIILKNKNMCPRCKIDTNFIATNNIESLRKKLEENPDKKLDSYILKLVKK